MRCLYSSCTIAEMEAEIIEFNGTKLHLYITESKEEELLATILEITLTLSLGVGHLTSGLTLRITPLKKMSIQSIK
jgi:hypothetical protein